MILRCFLFLCLSALLNVHAKASDSSRVYRNYLSFKFEMLKRTTAEMQSFYLSQLAYSQTQEANVVKIAIINTTSSDLSEKMISDQVTALTHAINQNHSLGVNLTSPRFDFKVVQVKANHLNWTLDSIENSPDFVKRITPSILIDDVINVVLYDGGTSTNAGFALPFNENQVGAIFINKRFWFGGPLMEYAQGKSLIHLFANYLGLPPLWGYNVCEDDGIDDTPIHNAPNYGCFNAKTHISTCEFGTLELVNNYMDNSDDECSNSFTSGQLDFLHHALAYWSVKNENSANEDIFPQPDLGIYPNPAISSFRVSFDAKKSSNDSYELRITNSVGIVMVHKTGMSSTFDFEIEAISWPNGVYNVVVTGSGVAVNQRVTVIK